MKSDNRCLPILLAILCLATVNVSADTPVRRIVFKRGAVSADVMGRLTGQEDVLRYVLRARARQHMQLKVDADGPTRGVVKFPDGGEDGGPGGVFFDDTLPVDGDYFITISESRMGEPWAGTVKLYVSIK